MKVYKFYADWCQPCKMLDAMLERIETDKEIVKINIDDSADWVHRWGVRGVPTMIMVDDNDIELKRKVGMLNNRQELQDWLNQ